MVVNTDPHAVRETTVRLDLGKLGVHSDTFDVEDCLTGEKFTWGQNNYVRLDSFVEPVHILQITKRK